MKRKKWTPKTEVTEADVKFREKRKWQIALRRYVLMQNRSSYYAPYFGLDMLHFRKWIEIQFTEGMRWDNFSVNWQLDHIIPVTYFDFGNEGDLRLCWNFTNIRAENLQAGSETGNRINVLAAKAYFETLYQQTEYPICREMLQKIQSIELSELQNSGKLQEFMGENREFLEIVASFSGEDFDGLNEGKEMSKVLEERAFRKKYEDG